MQEYLILKMESSKSCVCRDEIPSQKNDIILLSDMVVDALYGFLRGSTLGSAGS
jgi:hypothetical protein